MNCSQVTPSTSLFQDTLIFSDNIEKEWKSSKIKREKTFEKRNAGKCDRLEA